MDELTNVLALATDEELNQPAKGSDKWHYLEDHLSHVAEKAKEYAGILKIKL